MTITSHNQYSPARRNVWFVAVSRSPISDCCAVHVVYYRTKKEIKARKDVNPTYTVQAENLTDAIAHLPEKALAVIRNHAKADGDKYGNIIYYNTVEEA